MCNDDREKVVGKIRKLLALANDKANANEAVAAALKAQKLMADYDVSTAEIADLAEEVQEVTERYSTIGNRHNWRYLLADTVARNFRCKTYRTHIYGDIAMTFLGYPADAEAAKTVYEYLYRVGDELGKKARKEAKANGNRTNGVYTSYCIGFVRGVESELRKQCVALMLVCPQEVEEAFDNLDLSTLHTNGYRRSLSAEQSGEKAGRDAVRSQRMDGRLALA